MADRSLARRELLCGGASLAALTLAGCAGDGGGDGTTGTDRTTSARPTTTAGPGGETSAGPTTGGETDGVTTEPTSQATAGPTTAETASPTTAGATTEAAGPTTGGAVGSGSWRPFDFSRPGRWEYDAVVADSEGTVVLDVRDVSAGEVTVEVRYDVGDAEFQSTVTGAPDTVQSQLYGTPAGALLAATVFTPGAWYAGRELSVGTQWSVSTNEGSASFEVTGTDSVGGVDCFTTEMAVDGRTVYESCVSPDAGLAPYTATYDEDGSVAMSMTLREYTPGE